MAVKCPICGRDTTVLGVQKHAEYGCDSIPDQKPEQFSFTKTPDRTRPASNASTSAAPTPRSEPSTKKPRLESDSNGHQDTNSHSKLENSSPGSMKVFKDATKTPLAEQCRPQTLADIVGQQKLVGPHGILRQNMSKGHIPSMILWGPSGVGKTSFARVLAKECNAQFVELSAPQASTGDIKKVVADAKNLWRLVRRRTILFLDEIHRFNRAQQDSLLQAVERGDIVLVGATTENPSFKLTGALLSRTRVCVLDSLTEEDIGTLVNRALNRVGRTIPDEVVKLVVMGAQGDGRIALNRLETVLGMDESAFEDMEGVKQALRTTTVYDQKGDYHYDLISAFHKSVRGSDADAALYYLARMLQGGEDPLYLSRRMVRIASEDVGLADNDCLPLAVATHTAVQQIGMPEADCILAHCAVRLARANKSVEVYKALGRVMSDLKAEPALASAPVPLHIRNAPTSLMKDIGYGEGYKYNPDYEGPVDQEYLPEGFRDRKWL